MICVFHCFQPVQVPFWEKLHIFPAWSSNREGQKSSMIHMSGMHRRKPSQCLLAFISCIFLQHFLLFTRIAAGFWHISNLFSLPSLSLKVFGMPWSAWYPSQGCILAGIIEEPLSFAAFFGMQNQSEIFGLPEHIAKPRDFFIEAFFWIERACLPQSGQAFEMVKTKLGWNTKFRTSFPVILADPQKRLHFHIWTLRKAFFLLEYILLSKALIAVASPHYFSRGAGHIRIVLWKGTNVTAQASHSIRNASCFCQGGVFLNSLASWQVRLQQILPHWALHGKLSWTLVVEKMALMPSCMCFGCNPGHVVILLSLNFLSHFASCQWRNSKFQAWVAMSSTWMFPFSGRSHCCYLHWKSGVFGECRS